MNYVPYVKKEAMKFLNEEFCWKPYGGKHGESTYTHFFQSYILPKKFGFDKRRIHLSALIASGQMTREDALDEINNEIAPPKELEQEKEYVIKKLGLSEEEFEAIMASPLKSFWDYPSCKRMPIFRNTLVLSLYRQLFRRVT